MKQLAKNKTKQKAARPNSSQRSQQPAAPGNSLLEVVPINPMVVQQISKILKDRGFRQYQK